MKSLEIHLHNAPVIPLTQAEDSDIALLKYGSFFLVNKGLANPGHSHSSA